MREIRTSFSKVVSAAIFITLLISVIPVLAVDYTVGVNVGDWIKYGEFHASVTGTMTGLSQIAAMNDIDWMKMEVTDVSGTEVTVESTGSYKNGTTLSASTSKVDVATGNATGFFVFLIGADLKEGDDVIPQQQAGLSLKINGTTTRAYCGAMRSVNYLDISMSIMGQSITARWYWDKATGVMMETFTSMSITTPSTASMEISLKAVGTNMWSADVLGTISGNLVYIIGIIVVVVVVIGVGVFMLRRRKPTPPVTPTPTAVEETPTTPA